jgi:DNA-binding NtrC family response regulator
VTAPTLRATILVLDDNTAVQELVDQMLRESGHRVLTTRSRLEAVEALRRVRFDIVVLGVLAAERFHAVVEEFRSIQAELRVVSIAGPDGDLGGTERAATLPTPFSLEDLRTVTAAGLERDEADGVSKP